MDRPAVKYTGCVRRLFGEQFFSPYRFIMLSACAYPGGRGADYLSSAFSENEMIITTETRLGSAKTGGAKL